MPPPIYLPPEPRSGRGDALVPKVSGVVNKAPFYRVFRNAVHSDAHSNGNGHGVSGRHGRTNVLWPRRARFTEDKPPPHAQDQDEERDPRRPRARFHRREGRPRAQPPHRAPRVPKRELVVFTGPSGSGKSCLAFDTLYAEGQRRYVETLSAYARQFLGQLERPKVERIRGLSPTIAIEQKSASSNPRSTVGTITEIYDYLRVLYARVGEQRCIDVRQARRGRRARARSRELLELPEGTKRAPARAARHAPQGRAPRALRRPRDSAASCASIVGRRTGRSSIDDPPASTRSTEAHDRSLVVDRVTVRARGPAAPHRGGRARAARGQGRAASSRSKGKNAPTFSAKRAVLRQELSRAQPAELLVQQPARHVPALQRPRHARSRSTRTSSCRTPRSRIRKGAIAPWAAAMSRGDGWMFRIAEAAAPRRRA